MTEGIRGSFLVYLIGEETSSMIQLRMEMVKSGFHILNFRKIELAFDRIAKNPPHIVVCDFDGQNFSPDQYLKKFSDISPETLHLAFIGDNRIPQIDVLVDMGFYGILNKESKSWGAAIHILDRAIERLYLQYQGEQLIEQNKKHISEMESQLRAKGELLSALETKSTQLENHLEDLTEKNHAQQMKIGQLEAELEASESKTQRYISDYVNTKSEKENLEEQLRRYRGDLGTSNVSFTGLVQSLNKCHSVDEAIQDWSNKICRLYGETPVAFFRYIPGHTHLVLNQCAGLNIEKVRGIGIPLSGLSPKEQKSFYTHVRFVANMRDLLKAAFKVSEYEFRELVTDRGIVGICVLFKGLSSDVEKRFFSDSIELLNLVCHRNSLAFRIHDSDSKDDLTQLESHRSVDKILASEISRARRTELPLTAMYIRVDNFSDHEKMLEIDSDRILRSVATILRKTSRVNDHLFRIEKDQFVALLPATNRNGGCIKAESFRKLIEKAQIKDANGENIPGVRVSIGVSEYPAVCKDAEGLLASADEALFDAIKGGGNQVRVASIYEEPKTKFSSVIHEQIL